MRFLKAGSPKPLLKTLHITSEQKTAMTINASNLEGDTLVWQDALYEGPLLADMSLDALSTRRAEYFSQLGWGEYSDIMKLYQQRNAVVSSFLQYSEIVLWFDSGLNNQLQLVQLIEWFSRQQTRHVVISVVSRARLPDVIGFVDFALLTERQLEKLFHSRTEVTNAQITICHNAWRALTAQNPTGLLHCFPRDMTSMPYLKNAMLRFVQQFPSKSNGLSKTEQLIIYVLRSQQKSDELLDQQAQMERTYLDVQGKEPIPFMSRAIFYAYFQNMMLSEQPIIAKHVVEQTEALEISEEDGGEDLVMEAIVVEKKTRLTLTKLSGQISNNWVDWVQINGINRWLGGVYLRDGNIWRYSADTRQLIKTYV